MKQPSLFRQFVQYVSLNILAMLGFSFYILADTFFISMGAGAEGLAALNLVIPVYNLLSGVSLMIGVGGATVYSIARAQRKQNEADLMFTVSLVTGVICGVGFMLFSLFSAPICHLLGADAVIFPLANSYLRTLMCFSPLFVLNNIMTAFVRNDGAPRLAMAAMLFGSLSNVIFDYLFVIIFDFGMFGAALATGTCPILSLALLSLHKKARRNGFHFIRNRLRFSTIPLIVSPGLSSLITEISGGVVIVIFNFAVLGLQGNTGVAAYSIVANLSLVATCVFSGIAQGIQPIVNTQYGMGNTVNVRKTAFYATAVSLLLSLTIYLLCFVYTTDIVALFNKNHDQLLTKLAVPGLPLYFSGFFFAGINIILAAFFSCSGRPILGFVVSVLRGFIVIIPMIFLFAHLFGMTGVWLSYPAAEGVTLLLALLLLRIGKHIK